MLIASLLVAHAALMVSFAVVAGGDPSFGVEPDYYEKALEWDESRAKAGEPGEDGFALSTTLTPTGAGRGEVLLMLRHGDEPVSQATLSAVAFCVARAGDRQNVELLERTPGLYGSDLDLTHDGWWEVRYELTTPERTYRFARRLMVQGAAR